MVYEEWDGQDNEERTYFGIDTSKANPKLRKIINDCIFRERHPNY
ncbi:MAG: hypothetical protein ACTSRI_18355 [Promethearchaeota archaeon]